jgi:hypothetical protein
VVTIVFKFIYRIENPFIIYPSLELAGNLWSGGPVINHHIRVIAHAPQSFYPVQVLFVSAAVVGQHIDTAFSVTFDIGQLQKAPKAGY